MLYNQLATESMLSRLQGIMSGKEADYLDDLNLDDEDSNGYLPFDQIQKVWKTSGLPSLDDELTEFMEYAALRVSPSLKKVNYEDFCKIFEEDFQLGGDTEHDDETPFDASEETPDAEDVQAIKERRQAKDASIKKSNDGDVTQNQDEEDPEIDSDDLMLYIDEALLKIINKLPEKNKK